MTKPMEITVISGKGGTGKTSLTASFAILAKRPVVADCDVDAADLHLVLKPRVIRRETYSGGKEARIKTGHCTACGKCEEICAFGAVFFDGPGNGRHPRTFRIDPIACEGCGVCAHFCAEHAIDFSPAITGQWFISECRSGPMVHARLGIAAENSGKLVSLVRREAMRIAEEKGHNMILVDGPPGIGCPVIASVTGTSRVLAVTEPTVSGEHDLERVIALTRHFEIPTYVCINKWDLNPGMTERIEQAAIRAGALLAGRVRYDRGVTRAQMEAKTAIEIGADCAVDIRDVWETISS